MQCIIVVPEGQTLEDAVRNADVSAAQVNVDHGNTTPSQKWTKRLKQRLLDHIFSHVQMHKGKRIDSSAMWNEIAEKIPNKSPAICRRMYLRIKKNKLDKSGDAKIPPYYAILDKILALEPKFFRKPKIILEDEMKVEALDPNELVDMDIMYNYNV